MILRASRCASNLHHILFAGLIVAACLPRPEARAQEPENVEATDEELDQHAASLRQQAEDPKLDLSHRETYAGDLASLLDRAAQAAKDPESQRRRWNQAITDLDTFERQTPVHPQSRAFRLRAAVFRWASARSLRRQFDLTPARPVLREATIAELDDAVKRLRALSTSPAEKDKDPALDANVQYRLAQSLADRAEFEENNPTEQTRLVSEAKNALKEANGETALQGFVKLLKGELLRREGKFDEALTELDAASKTMPPAPDRQLIGVKVSVLTAAKRFDEAIKTIQGAQIDDPTKRLMTVEVRLAQRSNLAPAGDRYPIEALLFDDLVALRAKSAPEYRLGILALAKARIEPDPRLGAEAWDLLADSQEALGDPIRASALYGRAAVRAEDSGHPDQSARYRLKAGALLFRAGRFLEAEATLAPLTKSGGSGDRSLRAKANILRAMAIGRALALKTPGATLTAYKDTLEGQIRDFPDDPSSDEARWLLGGLLRNEGLRDRARSLWVAIGAKSPRWLDSRHSVASLDREDLENEMIATGSKPSSDRVERATNFLVQATKNAPDESASNEMLLLQAVLNVSPEMGRADDARALAERVEHASPTDGQKYRAALIRMIAMTELGRYIESEMIARDLGSPRQAEESSAFLKAVRLLDRSAALAETDLRQRRFGTLMRTLLTPVFARGPARWQGDTLAELHMRLTRGLIFSGDERAAKGSLASWKGSNQIRDWGDPLLRDLADTYARLGAYGLVLDVQRLRLRSVKPGSAAWFDAKYGTALAFYRAGMTQDALQLIDATAILHPELGGPNFKEKFDRLRQRLKIGR